MREFIYYSNRARTSGNWKDLMKAGRMDIVCNFIIQTFFLSNKMRDDIHLHLVFTGPPNPPVHIEIISDKELPISKKDIGGLLKIILYKVRKGKKVKVFPGCFVEKKSFSELVRELEEKGKKILILDKRGEDIRKSNLDNSVFVIGDHEGLPKKEIKRFKNRVSLGDKVYFASQTAIIINNELDRRGGKESSVSV